MADLPMYYYDDADGLVHVAREGWPCRVLQHALTLAHTRCGHLVTETDVQVNSGRFVPVTTPLTCVRCLGGAMDGEEKRQNAKTAAFAMIYGHSVHGLMEEYSKAEIRIMREWTKKLSVYRRCSQLTHVLYQRAIA